jgi:hypothetical protein
MRTKMRKALIPAVGRVLKRLHYPLDVILTCVRWYVAYPLSLRHLEEMMPERGIWVDHSTIVELYLTVRLRRFAVVNLEIAPRKILYLTMRLGVPGVRSRCSAHIGRRTLLNSHAADFKNPDIRQYLDKYVRGSNGYDAPNRAKVMKPLWNAIGTEFGNRHELYERNYGENHEAIRTHRATGHPHSS